MSRIIPNSFHALISLTVLILAAQFTEIQSAPTTVQTGSGTTIDLPQSNVVPKMDRNCP